MNISTISSIEDSKAFCEKFFEDSPPFISFEFFKCLERTGCTNFDTGWEPEHLILESNKKSIGPHWAQWANWAHGPMGRPAAGRGRRLMPGTMPAAAENGRLMPGTTPGGGGRTTTLTRVQHYIQYG